VRKKEMQSVSLLHFIAA